MMTKVRPLFIATPLVLGLAAGPAQALLPRTFVSANGNDANTCGRATPCRSFQIAHDKASAGGEINVLDPAGYGALTITKSISVVNDGVGSAGVLVPAGATGITINAGPNDAINLRGLAIEGTGVGSTGIAFSTGGFLTIENCVVRNLTGSGIALGPSASTSMAISSTLVADNGAHGIYVQPSGSGAVSAVFTRVEARNNGQNGIGVYGNFSTGSVKATIADSSAVNNGDTGFLSYSVAGKAVTGVMVVRSVSDHNVTGLFATSANAVLWVGQSSVTNNTSGWGTVGTAVLLSYGDNTIDGNLGGQAAPPLVGKK